MCRALPIDHPLHRSGLAAAAESGPDTHRHLVFLVTILFQDNFLALYFDNTDHTPWPFYVPMWAIRFREDIEVNLCSIIKRRTLCVWSNWASPFLIVPKNTFVIIVPKTMCVIMEVKSCWAANERSHQSQSKPPQKADQEITSLLSLLRIPSHFSLSPIFKF